MDPCSKEPRQTTGGASLTELRKFNFNVCKHIPICWALVQVLSTTRIVPKHTTLPRHKQSIDDSVRFPKAQRTTTQILECTFGPHEHATDHTTSLDTLPEQGIAYARPRNKARYGSCIEGYDSWFTGPAAAESLDGTASLKPIPSICHSGFDPLDCRDGDHSFGGHRIEWGTSMYSAQLRLLTVAPSRSSRQCSLGECNSGGLPLAFLSCDMTWPMEVMPHDDIASFCLAAP